MKTARLLACCLLIFPLIGTVLRSVPKTRAKSLLPTKVIAAPLDPFHQLLLQGADFFGAGEYENARSRFESARQVARNLGETVLEARAMGNIGGCQFATHQYQAALHTLLEAHRLAESAGDPAAAAPIDANIAALYGQMGEVDAAVEWLQASLRRMKPKDREDHLPKVQIELASFRARQDRREEARQLFRQGLEGADRAGNHALYATGWYRLGEEYLRQRDLPNAEHAFLEAYRVRKLFHLPLIQDYWNLGELRLAQGDAPAASALLDRAVELAAEPRSTMPVWHVYDARGRARLALGRPREALEDLRVAVRLARAWRASAPTDDFARMGAEHVLSGVYSAAGVYSALIEAGNRLYLETHDPALVRETFEAAEENRAASLRWLVNGSASQADLPPTYWEAIARLQRAEVAALRSHDAATQEAVQAARAEIVQMEASLLKDSQPQPTGMLDRVRAALGREAVLLSFQLGESVSWLWALDRAGLTLYRLPPRAEIEAQIKAASEALRQDATEYPQAAAKLYGTLFGALPRALRRKATWLLAFDQSLEKDLFDVPVAALVEEGGPVPVYAAERHTIEVIPGASYWVESATRQHVARISPIFVGIGDAIYNNADPRSPVRQPGSGRGLALPRLVGSGAELDACSRAWNGEHVLLEGADASRAKLVEELRRNPAVVHFATHMLESSDRARYGLIALSLTVRNETELLPPIEIASWRIRAAVVVLSGCHSAEGENKQWAGMVGLTRAWLSAGAESVVASRWDTPDDEGPLFQVFYRTLSGQDRQNAAEALRAAQLDMIRSGGWRARPRYWGAYFVVGNQ
ncbi:MAG TPA: CHAT domain-containing protein [Bryobacteraceae bacterium]|nr:CHAT domain-containing protein [Bryobacteraceae bacterium]